MKLRAPMTAGGFGMWCMTFSAFDCTFAKLRKKEDPWNAILSGVATGAVTSARQGWKGMCMSAIMGGIMLSLFEGIGVFLSRQGAEHTRPQAPILPN